MVIILGVPIFRVFTVTDQCNNNFAYDIVPTNKITRNHFPTNKTKIKKQKHDLTLQLMDAGLKMYTCPLVYYK